MYLILSQANVISRLEGDHRDIKTGNILVTLLIFTFVRGAASIIHIDSSQATWEARKRPG